MLNVFPDIFSISLSRVLLRECFCALNICFVIIFCYIFCYSFKILIRISRSDKSNVVIIFSLKLWLKCICRTVIMSPACCLSRGSSFNSFSRLTFLLVTITSMSFANDSDILLFVWCMAAGSLCKVNYCLFIYIYICLYVYINKLNKTRLLSTISVLINLKFLNCGDKFKNQGKM